MNALQDPREVTSDLAQTLVMVALEPRNHQLALQALLTAFCAIAEVHGCCTVAAAEAAQRAADKLRAIDASRTVPPSLNLH